MQGGYQEVAGLSPPSSLGHPGRAPGWVGAQENGPKAKVSNTNVSIASALVYSGFSLVLPSRLLSWRGASATCQALPASPLCGQSLSPLTGRAVCLPFLTLLHPAARMVFLRYMSLPMSIPFHGSPLPWIKPRFSDKGL